VLKSGISLATTIHGAADAMRNANGEEIDFVQIRKTQTAIVELAADSRQMSSRYGGPCAAISNAEDVVRSANPMGFTFSIQQSMVPNRGRYQSTFFEKSESLVWERH